MSAAIALGDIIRIGVHLLLERIIPLHGNFNSDTVFAVNREMKDVIKWRFVLIKEGHKGA